MATLLEKAQTFRSLQVPGTPVVLPNAWDAASARVVADAGARAVATTSAGVAWSLGRVDGDHLTRDQAIGAIARITAAVDVPVTAYIERGYAIDPVGVAETVRGVLAAGAGGINLEDTLRPVAEQSERIAAARRAPDETGVPLFVDARIDTHRLPSAGRTVRWTRRSPARGPTRPPARTASLFSAHRTPERSGRSCPPNPCR